MFKRHKQFHNADDYKVAELKSSHHSHGLFQQKVELKTLSNNFLGNFFIIKIVK